MCKRSRLIAQCVEATTDKRRFTQIEINNPSVFICVHLRFTQIFLVTFRIIQP
jgi:hypothetical protein